MLNFLFEIDYNMLLNSIFLFCGWKSAVYFLFLYTKNMKKSFFFRWVSILGAVLLLATSVMPGLTKVYAESYSENPESLGLNWEYIYDETTWNEAYANPTLQAYYAWSDQANAPYKEDLWNSASGRAANINDAHKTNDEYDLDENGNYIYDNCERNWSGAVSAPWAKYPWAVVSIPKPFTWTISFSYNGWEPVYPWGEAVRSFTRGFGIASIPEEFKNNSFLIPENAGIANGEWEGEVGEASTFDPTELVITLIQAHNLTIHYVYSNWDEAAEAYTWEILDWEEYSHASPDIANYTPDVATVSGTITDDVEVTVTYAPTNDVNENGIADEEETTYTVSFDTNWWTPATIESQTNLLPGQKAEKPENPTKEWNVFAWWLDDESNEFDFDQAFENITWTATKTVALTAQWEAMTSSWGAMIEQEDGTGTWMVVEADTPATSTDASSVQSSNSTATVQWEVELDVYNDADWDWAADGTGPISTKVNFTNPVLVRIPVSSWTSVKVKVKHNGESTFGIEWLTTNSGASCADWVSDAAYDGSEIPANWFAEIWTCSASTFVAYTEEANPSSPSNGGSWGGGGSSKTTKADDAKATTGDDAAVNETNAEENNWENAEEQKPTMTEAQAVEKFGQEQIDAYKWALENGITTMKTVEAARLDEPLTRAELAKMMVVYIQKVVQKDPVVTGDVSYSDVSEELGDLYGYIKLAYQYQIMWINADGTPIELFNPYGIVSRWEYATVFSRVLFGAKFNKDGEDFYTNHLEALKTAEILTNTTPSIQEMRGWVMLMMYRSSQNGEAIEKVANSTEETADETKADETANEETATDETKTETNEETKAEETTNAEATTGDTAEAPATEETSETTSDNTDTTAEATTWDVAEVNTWAVAEVTTWDTASS